MTWTYKMTNRNSSNIEARYFVPIHTVCHMANKLATIINGLSHRNCPPTQLAQPSLSPFPPQLPCTAHAMPAARSSLLFCSDASLLASSICFSRAFLLAFLPWVLASLALASANISFSEERSWGRGDRDIIRTMLSKIK